MLQAHGDLAGPRRPRADSPTSRRSSGRSATASCSSASSATPTRCRPTSPRSWRRRSRRSSGTAGVDRRLRRARAGAGGAGDEGGPGRSACSPAATCWTSSRTAGSRPPDVRALGHRRRRRQGARPRAAGRTARPVRRGPAGGPRRRRARGRARASPTSSAIDAPPRWAADGQSRATENELARLNIHAFHTPSASHGSSRTFDWMRRGMEVFDARGWARVPARDRAARGRDARSRSSPTRRRRYSPAASRPRACASARGASGCCTLAGVRTEELTTARPGRRRARGADGAPRPRGARHGARRPGRGRHRAPDDAPAPRYRPGTLGACRPRGTSCSHGARAGPATARCRAGREFAQGHDAKRKSHPVAAAARGTRGPGRAEEARMGTAPETS